MRIFLFFSIILILYGCSTVKIAKEINKATESIKTSVEKIVNDENSQKNSPPEELVKVIPTESIEKEIAKIEIERKKEKKLIIKQKKIIEISFIGKKLYELTINLGEPNLIRIDGNTKIARFDTNACRLFLFLNSNKNLQLVEHYEIRDVSGNLINIKNIIVFNNIQLMGFKSLVIRIKFTLFICKYIQYCFYKLIVYRK